ncbi:MAG: hypothetical protein K0S75_847 [Clostridia bacterium]|jgi:hypothetical protein|nr:hypothetical protein [Clostridia bacterium]
MKNSYTSQDRYSMRLEVFELDKDCIYYLSHPCTTFGDPAANRYAAAIYERCLSDMHQITMINPIVIIPVNTEDSVAMIMCRKMFDVCGAIIMCPNWDKSKGCNEEFQWALQDNKPIYILNQDLTVFRYELAG